MTVPSGADSPPRTWRRYEYWPHVPGDWAAHTAPLSGERANILLRIYGVAFKHGTPPWSILDDEAEFFRLLGESWRDHLPWLRHYFVPDPAFPGRLCSPWLRAKWEQVNSLVEPRSKAGIRSGEVRRARAHANKRGRKPRDGNDLNTVQRSSNSVEQGSNSVEQKRELSSRENPSRVLSREESGADVAAAGRGVPTAAPPSPNLEHPGRPTGATSPPVATPGRRAGAPVAIGAVQVRPPAAPPPSTPLPRSAAAQLASGRVSRPSLVAADSLGPDDPPRGAMERWVLEHAPEELEERLAAAQEAQPNAPPAALRMPAISQVYRRHHPTPMHREEALAR